MGKCDWYFQHGLKSVCYGTKEMEACSCGGDERKCNFYPEKRKPKIATEKRLISLDETLNATHKEVFWTESEAAAVRSFLVKQPKVDAVEVVHGRWEPHMEEMEDFFGKMQLVQTGLMCSECGHYSCCGGNFCNNCGAKMDEERKENNNAEN